MQEIVDTSNAPRPIGPYSQAIRANGLVFVSGQIPVDPSTGEVVPGDIEAQTHQVLRNLSAILAEAGSGLEKVVKTTIYMTDLEDFSRLNTVYAGYFSDCRPARATVQVAKLPREALVEIEATALA